MQKTCGRWRERGVFFCFDLVSFLRRPYYLCAWHRLQNTGKLSICLHHRESLTLGCTEAPHVSSSVPNVISKNSTKPNQRPKAQLGVSKRTSQHILQETLCLSAQERLIILTEIGGQNLSTRIGGKDGRKGNRCTHLLCFFINVSFESKALQLLFNFQLCCKCRISHSM